LFIYYEILKNTKARLAKEEGLFITSRDLAKVVEEVVFRHLENFAN